MKHATQAPLYLRDYRPSEFLITTVDLRFELSEESMLVHSTLHIIRNPKAPIITHAVTLDGDSLELISVTLNNQLLKPDQYEVKPDALTIYNVPNEFDLTIQTQLKPHENKALSGLYQSSGNFCTQCEAHGFRRITYFLDRPDVMSLFTTTIIADEKKYPILLSNGNLIHSEKKSDGKHQVTWQDPFKKPSYLFALVGGDLDYIHDTFITQSGREIKLSIYVEKGYIDYTTHAMNAVKKAMRWDEERFGREYDLDGYMIVAVSDFNMGAMENKGLNIFNTQYILASPDTATDMDYLHIESVIAHEYFHNWTGNRITCRDWFQLSLKEGLTIFRDQSFTEDTTSKTVARIHDVKQLRAMQFSEDAGPLAHAVRPDVVIEFNNFYTATIYNKGAEVIRMQQTLLGHELFRQGMDIYFSRHDGEAVTIDDFVRAMEDASSIDLHQFRLWYSQAGTPVLSIQDEYDPKKQEYTLTIEQTCPATPGQPHKKSFHIPIKMGLLDHQGKELSHELLQLKQAKETFHFKHIPVKPIPSLLRGFSAPVKLHYAYQESELQILMMHDTDLFNRWEAGQQYATRLMLQLVNDYRLQKPLHIPHDYIAALQHLLLTIQDPWLLAEMLTLPTEQAIADNMAVIDVEAIHDVHEYMLKQIASQLKDRFMAIYEKNNTLDPSSEWTIHAMGQRQLKNTSLFYLMQLDDASIQKQFGLKQFHHAINHNMTDTMAALSTLVSVDDPMRDEALALFYQTFQHNPLVMDKWFALQASSTLPDTLNRIKMLLKHPAFDIKNPNKVYALLGTLGNRNAITFHAADGSGYQLLADCVLEIDTFNPQIASRMIKPFSDWRRYDSVRQHLMHEQLERILHSKHLSKNVFEIVSKSLKN